MSNKPKVLDNLKKGLLFVISAPAGTGKTTLVHKLIKEFDCVTQSISYTTRSPRGSEQNGVDYNFVSKEEFEKMIAQDDFLEYAKVFDNYYGTSKSYITKKQNEGKHVVLVIDTQGAMQIREKTDAILVFLAPPSKEVLEERLLHRATDSCSAIEERLSWYEKEMQVSKNYDYFVMNQDIQIAYDVFRAIFIAEEHRNKNIKVWK